MIFDPRLSKLIEILRFAYKVIRREGVARKGDLVPPMYRNDTSLLAALPDILVYFNIADRSGQNLYYKLRSIRGQRLREYEKKVDRLVAVKLKLFQIFFWKTVSRTADEFEPHERLSEIRAFLRSYGLRIDNAQIYIKMMILLGRAKTVVGAGGGIRIKRDAPNSDALLPPRGDLIAITSNRNGEPKVEKAMVESDLYKSLKFFFQKLRAADEVSEHFEYKGWQCSIVNSKQDGSTHPLGIRIMKDKEGKKPDWGDMRNPDLVGYRVEKCDPFGAPEIEVLAVEVKDKGEFKRESIAQAMSYLEFSNIVYIALDAPYSQIKKHTLLLNSCMKAGIGIITLEGNIPGNRDDDEAWAWDEAVPARYQAQRKRANAFLLEKYFPHALTRIKNEYYSHMGPFKLQVPS
ncbi:MAG: hypothetical protein JNM27_18630 [Leptospirales bacterium]|nr:hypothetical protein [Leptospirales bacterium]